MKADKKCLLCGRDAQCVEQNYPGYQEPDTFFIYNCAWLQRKFHSSAIFITDFGNIIFGLANAGGLWGLFLKRGKIFYIIFHEP